MSNEPYKPLPPWSKMPHWAMFRTIDKDGTLCAFQYDPELTDIDWGPEWRYDLPTKWSVVSSGHDAGNWRDSIEMRPQLKLIPTSFLISETSLFISIKNGKWIIETMVNSAKSFMTENFSLTSDDRYAATFDSPEEAYEFFEVKSKS